MVVIRGIQSMALLCLMSLTSSVSANTEVDAFLTKATALTYDCPEAQFEPQTDAYLGSSAITEQQRLKLQVLKSSYLNCNGSYDLAQKLLFEVVDHPEVDLSSYYYAAAIFHIGFNYDAKEDFENRCQFYQQARELGKGKFEDIYLTSSLGMISACDPDSMKDKGVELGKLFAILERYSSSGDYQALAYIHNTIGLLYGQMDQHVLAAEQYIKAHEMGLQVYTGSNRLSIYISAISSLLGSGQYDRAAEALKEFDRINQDIGTPLTNYWYQFARAGYYYRVEDIERLKGVLPDLELATKPISNALYESFLAWYALVPCVYESDFECMASYADKSSAGELMADRYFSRNPDYLRLKIKMFFALGQLEQARTATDAYSEMMIKRRHNLQSSANTLSVATLYSKIYSLEAAVEAEEMRKRHAVIGISAFFVLLLSVVGFIARRKYQKRMSIDNSTGLLNAAEVVKRISGVAPPDYQRTNALAIFDLQNIRELNRTLGATEGDRILRLVADTIRRETRGNDLVGRLAPEQFIVCLHNIEEVQAQSFFKQLQAHLEDAFTASHPELRIGLHTNSTVYTATDKFEDIKAVLKDMLFSLSVESRLA